MKQYLVAIFVALFTFAALAAIPQVISYQGRLTDSVTDEPISGTFILTFELYDAETGGSHLWTESHTVEVDSNGLYSVKLGSINPFAGSADFSEQYWLEISIDDSVELVPRYKLGSSPYSIHAGRADTARYADTAAFATSANNAGYSTHSDTAVFATSATHSVSADTASSVSWDNIADMPAGFADGIDDMGSGGGTYIAREGIEISGDTVSLADRGIAAEKLSDMGASNGQVLKWNATDTLWEPENPGDNDWSFSGTNKMHVVDIKDSIGIGTTDPNAKLEIIGQNNDTIQFGATYPIEPVGMRIQNSWFSLVIENSKGTAVIIDTSGGNGIEISQVAGDGVSIWDTGNDGFSAYEAGRYGVYVDRPDSHGIVVDYAGGDGMRINKPKENGIVLDHPHRTGLHIVKPDSGDAIRIDSTTADYDGITIFKAGNNGINIAQTAVHGIFIQNAGHDGMRIDYPGHNGIYVNQAAWHGMRVNRPDSHGVYIKEAQEDGVNIDHPVHDGVEVWSSGGHGLHVRSSSGDGVHVNDPTQHGVYIDSTGANYDGIRIHYPGRYGVYVDSSGSCGICVRKPFGDGIFVFYPESVGVNIKHSGTDGIDIVGATGHGIRIDSSGVEGIRIARTGEYGLSVRHPGWHGILVDSTGPGWSGLFVREPGADGVNIYSPEENGVYVLNPTQDGFQVDYAGVYGMHIHEPASHGIYITSPNTYGMYITGSGDHGVRISEPGNRGVEVDSALTHGYGVWYSGSNGVHVWYPGIHGVAVHETGQSGLFVMNAGSNGVYVQGAGSNCFVCNGVPLDVPRFKVRRDCKVFSPGYYRYIIDDDGIGIAAPIPVATENWFEHIGQANLSGGECRINLPQEFLEAVTINEKHPIHVFITPLSPMGEYWVEKGNAGFVVHQTSGGDPSAAFDYRVVARVWNSENEGITRVDIKAEQEAERLVEKIIGPND